MTGHKIIFFIIWKYFAQAGDKDNKTTGIIEMWRLFEGKYLMSGLNFDEKNHIYPYKKFYSFDNRALRERRRFSTTLRKILPEIHTWCKRKCSHKIITFASDSISPTKKCKKPWKPYHKTEKIRIEETLFSFFLFSISILWHMGMR